MIRIACITFFTFHFSFFTFAQQPNLDSLWAVWSDPTQPDTVRLLALDDYAYYGYDDEHPDSAFYFAQIEYDYAQSLGLKKFMAIALMTQVESWKARDNYAKALEYQLRVMRIAEEIEDTKILSSSLKELGTYYAQQGDYLHALEYFDRNLKIQEQAGDQIEIAGMLNNIGIIYNRQRDYTKALEYYQRCLKIQEAAGVGKYMGGTLINIAIIYANLQDTLTAVDYFQRGLKICEEEGLKLFQANALSGLAGLYAGQGDFEKGLDYFQRSLSIHEDLGAKIHMANVMTNIGNLYTNKNDFQSAIVWCKKGLTLATELGTINRQQEACDCLYSAYKGLGKDNEALVYLEKKGELELELKKDETIRKLQQMEFAKVQEQDSLANAEKARIIEEAHQAEVNEKNRTRNLLLVSALLLILVAAGLFLRWRATRKSRDLIAKEKDRSEHILHNILPAEIAQELKEKGRAEARDFEMVSILFSDFKGFTETSSSLSPQELVAEINACFEAFDGIMTKYGIEKIKTIGDAYMAAGGLPVPTDDSVKNTVLAALEMQAFITDRKTTKNAAGLPAFDMRIGIHTGEVVAGIVGVKKFQYDIWGDTVNTASRIESNGEAGKVNISQATYDLLKEDADFTFESRGKVAAKGKGEIEMYFVSKS